jgi:hypothetical protein
LKELIQHNPNGEALNEAGVAPIEEIVFDNNNIYRML